MAGVIPITSRTSSLQASNNLLIQLNRTQQELLEAERQASTGFQIQNPSDEPSDIAAVLFLQRTLSQREQQERNIDAGLNVLDTADLALGDAANVLREAVTQGSSQVGVGSDSTTRESIAEVVNAGLQSLIEIGNRQFANLSVFGGNNGATGSDTIFSEFLGGIIYNGGDTNLQADFGTANLERFTSNGLDAFGSLSQRIQTLVDLDPQAAAGVRIADVNGAQNLGVRLGSINVTVNGSATTVDLTSAETLGDVVTRVNDAITTDTPGAGSLALSGDGFALTAAAGNTIAISDIVAGQTALDLGLSTSATGATVVGPSVGTRLTANTALADFATPVDFASGLTITQGTETRTADFSSATTVEDLINVIDQLGIGLKLEINQAGTGLNLRTLVSGLELSVGENGGTTAADLGLRSFGVDTNLSDFRNGLGVESVVGENDFAITLHDGTTFEVDVSSATNVQEVVNAIEAAATTAGLAVPGAFDADLAANGNGFVLTDNTVGASDFEVVGVNASVAADHLGILKQAGAGTTITGDDNAKVRVENSFTHVIDLRDALRNDDEFGISVASNNLENDVEEIVKARAIVGVQAGRLQDQLTRIEDLTVTEREMLSELQDADLTAVLTKYSQLQLQLQASLQIGSQNQNLSLLDFLR